MHFSTKTPIRNITAYIHQSEFKFNSSIKLELQYTLSV